MATFENIKGGRSSSGGGDGSGGAGDSISINRHKPDLPKLISHLTEQYFAEEENVQTFFKDVEAICAGKSWEN